MTVLPVTAVTFRSRKITVVAAAAGEARDVLRAVGRLAVEGRLDPGDEALAGHQKGGSSE